MIRGIVELDVFDSTGKLKKHIKKHNTVTQLGKMAALTRGVAGLFDYCSLYGAGVQKTLDTGDYINAYTPSFATELTTPPTKPTSAVVTCKLTSRQASQFAGHSQVALADSEILGYCSSEIATSLDVKQGIRVNARNANADMIVASDKRQAARYSWTGIEGNLNTIAMFIPPLAIQQLADSYNTADATNKTSGFTGFIPTGDANVTGKKIAIGANHNKLLDLEQLTLADFTPGTSAVAPASSFGRNAFEFGNYIITFAPCTGSITNYSRQYTQQKVTVYNKNNNAFYAQNLIDTSSLIYGFFVNSNTLYAIVGGNVYSCAVTDSAITLTQVTAAIYVDSSWLVQYSSKPTWAFIPVQQGSTYYTYCIVVDKANTTANCYLMDDLINAAADRYIAPGTTSNGTEYSTGSVIQAYDVCHGGVYLNCLYEIETTVNNGTLGMYIAPAGQWGNLFSYFDLEETVEIGTADTVQLTYYYQLEDQQ